MYSLKTWMFIGNTQAWSHNKLGYDIQAWQVCNKVLKASTKHKKLLLPLNVRRAFSFFSEVSPRTVPYFVPETDSLELAYPQIMFPLYTNLYKLAVTRITHSPSLAIRSTHSLIDCHIRTLFLSKRDPGQAPQEQYIKTWSWSSWMPNIYTQMVLTEPTKKV